MKKRKNFRTALIVLAVIAAFALCSKTAKGQERKVEEKGVEVQHVLERARTGTPIEELVRRDDSIRRAKVFEGFRKSKNDLPYTLVKEVLDLREQNGVLQNQIEGLTLQINFLQKEIYSKKELKEILNSPTKNEFPVQERKSFWEKLFKR